MNFLRQFVLLLVPCSVALADFTAEWNEESGSFAGNFHSVWQFKGPKVRTTIVGRHGPVFSILDGATGEMTVYVAVQGIALRRNFAEEEKKRVAEKVAKGEKVDPEPPVATGAHEKVGTWDCEIYTRRRQDGSTQKTWVTRDIPNYREIAAEMKVSGNAAQATGMAVDLERVVDGIVVKEVSMDPAGKTKRTRTMQSINRNAIPDEAFAPMPGFKLIEGPDAPLGK